MSRADLHDNGVHVECRFPQRKTGGAVGIRPSYQDGGRPDWCLKAGTIERTHGHDFDGPLICGCDDFGT